MSENGGGIMDLFLILIEEVGIFLLNRSFPSQ